MHYAIAHNSVREEVCINKWLSYNQVYCFTAAILSAILDIVIVLVSNFYH